MKKKKRTAQEYLATYCDFCSSEAVPFSNRVQACPICGKDICRCCAIVTDHWYLEDGSFMGDHPDFYCRDCWEKGEAIREKILRCREAENRLWSKWHGM